MPGSANCVDPRPARVYKEVMNEIKWSAEQEAIFDWYRKGPTAGNLVVRARAGVGKSTVTAHGLSLAPEPKSCYAVFNKKAQLEAQKKITDPRVYVTTFHSLGYRSLKKLWPKARIGTNPSEIEYRRIERAAGGQCPDEVTSELKKFISYLKNTTINPTIEQVIEIAELRQVEADNCEHLGWTVGRLCEVALAVLEMSKVQERDSVICFDDMVYLPVAMGIMKAEFPLVVVDECQDMNIPQLEMARLACLKNGRVCVVGDDRQAIYEFRGAHQDGLNMMKTVLSANELPLTITYRCPKNVVAIAKAYVQDYQAAPTAPEGLVDNIGPEALQSKVAVGNVVLSRLNAPMMPLCLSLLRAGIPARIEGRDIGRSLIALIKKFKARSIPEYLKKVEAWGRKSKARTAVRNDESAQALIDDQVEMLCALAEGLAGVKDIENRITSLFVDSDGNQMPSVVFSTVHKAKGMEWQRVFILNETFKFRGGQEDNVYYVAVTRAMQHLTFVGERPAPKF